MAFQTYLPKNTAKFVLPAPETYQSIAVLMPKKITL
nr:MAG TPA: hypothetical protein [Caudoviricetes sp.]